MNERIKYLRKNELNLTQEEFSKKINISRANLGSIEIGRTSVTDRVIADICREFLVNEHWLRTGNGEIFISAVKESEASYFIGKLAKDGKQFKKNFIIFMLSQPDKYWDLLEEMINDFNNYYEKNKK